MKQPPHKIEVIKTGEAIAGSHVAIIYAPPNAAPGSLVHITKFLNEQTGIQAIAGYDGPDRHNVLRISGIKNDAELLGYLQNDFTAWCKKNHIYPCMEISEHVKITPIRDVDHFPFKPPVQSFLKEHANALSGASYVAADLGILYSGWRVPKGGMSGAKHDWFKIYSFAAYSFANVFLGLVGNIADNPRSAYQIIEDLSPNIKNMGDKEKSFIYDKTESLVNMLQANPWQTCAAITLTGTASHLASCATRGVKHTPLEIASVIGTLTAVGINLFVPERNDLKKSMSDSIKNSQSQLIDTAENIAKDDFQRKHSATIMENISDLMGGNPLKVSAALSAISNVWLGAAGIRQNDPGLMAASVGYLAGNYSQANASKTRGVSFDDIVTAASEAIRYDATIKGLDNKEVEKKINDFASSLAKERDVYFDENLIARGITSRIKNPDTGFLPHEREFINNSPFLSPHYNMAMGVENSLNARL